MDEVLEYIRNNPGSTSRQIAEVLGSSPKSIRRAVMRLRKKGFKIDNTNGYQLIESPPEFNGSDTIETIDDWAMIDTILDIEKIKGVVSLPLAIFSDSHIGSGLFSQKIWNDAVDVVRKRNIQHIIFPGDTFQGVDVYSFETFEVLDPTPEAQVTRGIEMFDMLPKGLALHFIDGNHERKTNAKRGINLTRMFIDRLRSKRPDLTTYYYGEVARLLIENITTTTLVPRVKKGRIVGEEEIDENWDLVMIHGNSGATNPTLPILRTLKRLSFKPKIFVMGHFHKIGSFWFDDTLAILPGTFQLRNAFWLSKGIVSSPGFIILDKRKDETGIERLVIDEYPYTKTVISKIER